MATLTTSNNPVDGTQFVVASEVMQKFMGMVERVARHVGTVLIVGETGTGKERIAQPSANIPCAVANRLLTSTVLPYRRT